MQTLRPHISTQLPQIAQGLFRVVGNFSGQIAVTVLQKNIAVLQKIKVTRPLTIGGIQIEKYLFAALFPHFPEQSFEIFLRLIILNAHPVDFDRGKVVFAVIIQKHGGKFRMVIEKPGVTRRTPQPQFDSGIFRGIDQRRKTTGQPFRIDLPEIRPDRQIVAGQFIETFALLP